MVKSSQNVHKFFKHIFKAFYHLIISLWINFVLLQYFKPRRFQTNSLQRSSHWRCTLRKAVRWNFAKSTEKHLCQSLILNKVADSGTGFLLWILRNFYEHLFNRTSTGDYFCLLIILHFLEDDFLSESAEKQQCYSKTFINS